MLVLLLACGAPPALTVDDPGTAPERGVVLLTLASDTEAVHVAVDGGPERLVKADLISLDTSGWPDGAHRIAVSAQVWWRRTEVEVVLHTDNTPPRIELAERSRSVDQGHALPVAVRTDEDARVTAHFGDRERTLYTVGPRTWRALVGVPIRAEPGPHPLVLTATDRLGNARTVEVPVEVRAVDWPFTGPLPLSRRKARVDPPAMVQMRTERDAIYAGATGPARWSGRMVLPVEDADHTSPFGAYREYPDGTRSHHDAEDLARKRWTPIHAAADGVVALAHLQEVHGNAVLIDHGHGVVTLYSHLQAFDVEEGRQVEQGELLGWMGSTGRTTGPHLHWGVVADRVAVDPMQWVEESFEPESFGAFAELADPRR